MDANAKATEIVASIFPTTIPEAFRLQQAIAAALEEAGRDTERLDWLEAVKPFMAELDGQWRVEGATMSQVADAPTLREAVDAAMKGAVG